MTHADRTATFHDAADPIDAAAEEFVARVRSGERPSVEEYAARHPAQADDIRKLFPMLLALEACGSTVEGPGRAAGVGREVGERVGGYTLGRRIGEGGMGVVFEAVQESLARPVAIKFLKAFASGRLARERFQRETQAIARLDHPNIVTVYGSGEHDGLPYYAMQLVRGRGLDALIGEHRAAGRAPGPADLRRAVGLVTQAADALAYAHRQGVVHRDVKPSNLLVDAADRVWVADFGLAHIDGGEHLTATGGVVGTRQYMAPEQYHGWADPRSDVYALGVTLYEVVTATPAFDGQTPQEVLRKVLHAEAVPPRKANPHIHPDLETVVLKAMAVEPAHRYQTAAALADDLRRFADGRPVSARRLSNAARAVRWAKRNPAAATLAAAVVLLMTAVTVLSAWAALRFNRLKDEAETARGTIERQRDRIGEQLADKEKADAEANAQLSRFLIRTAQAEMAGRTGGKREALKALAEASALSRRLDLPADHRDTLRREYIAALAMTDLVPAPDRTWEVPGLFPHTPAAFSACGKVFALADPAGGVSLRSADRNEEVRKLTAPKGEKPPVVDGLRFSATGKLLAGREHKTLWVWRADGELVGRFGPVVARDEAFDLLPDDTGIAWADGTDRLRVRRFAHAVDAQIASLPVAPLTVRCDPTGRRLAYCSWTVPTVFVHDLDRGETTRCPLPGTVSQLAWAPDGETFAVSGGDRGAVFVASVNTPTAPPLELHGHTGKVVQLAFHPHEDVLATCGWDQTVQVWDLSRPKRPTHVRHSLSYRGLTFTADGRWLMPGVADGRLWAWEWVRPTAGAVVVQYQAGQLHGAALRPDGGTLVGMGDGGLQAWDVTRPRRPVAVYPTAPQTAHEVAALGEFGFEWTTTAGEVAERLAGRQYRPLAVLSGRRVHFSADGRELTFGAKGGVTRTTVAGGSPGEFRLSGRITRRAVGGYEHTWSKDGSLLAVMPGSGDVKVFDADGVVASFPRPGDTGQPVVSPDNRWLACGAWPQPGVKVWCLRSHKEVATLPTTTSSTATFSPDGRWLVVGSGGGYQFYHTESWKPAHRIARTDCGHMPCPAAFTPDGKTVAVWTKPGHVAVLNPADGREYAVLPITARTGSNDTNGEIQFTAEGRLVVVANLKQIQVWDITDLRKQLTAVGLDWETPADAP